MMMMHLLRELCSRKEGLLARKDLVPFLGAANVLSELDGVSRNRSAYQMIAALAVSGCEHTW